MVGELDVVINNAGILTREITVSSTRELFNTNYYGVHILKENLIPLMRQNGRIINVSSQIGPYVLQEASPALQEKYTSSTLTKDQLDQLVEDFISAIESNNLESLGYNPTSRALVYGVSKAALTLSIPTFSCVLQYQTKIS
jgi:carbonyl reductase 1